jgi:hypothetical protein
MEEIRRHRDLKSFTGFATYEALPRRYAAFQIPSYSFKEHTRLLARSRIGIYVRGLHDSISVKFGQYLALGLPISGQGVSNNRELLFSDKSFAEQFIFESPQEIVQNARMLLQDSQKLAKLGRINSAIFDTKFTPETVVRAILARTHPTS